MSANIPFEIQEEIIKRVFPVKSLIRFTSVSKQWKSLITSSEFIADHSVNQTQPHRLLVNYKENSECRYVSIVDDDGFPQHKFLPIVSPTVNFLINSVMVDCSHGLVCLLGLDQDPDARNNMIVLWNPSIRKSVGIVLPLPVFTDVGFGVCAKTIDPKIVKMTRTTSMDQKAEVFTLSSGAWRSVPMNVPYKSIKFLFMQVVIDGVIHWLAHELSTNKYMSGRPHIISFDLASEEFEEVDLPDSLAHPSTVISISKLKESLAVIDYDSCELVCDVWKMTNIGDMKSSFAKLFTVSFKAYDGLLLYNIIGFRKNGQPIIKCVCRGYNSLVTTLEAYEPSTKHSSDLGIYGTYDSSFRMTSYTESLLLLNQSVSIILG